MMVRPSASRKSICWNSVAGGGESAAGKVRKTKVSGWREGRNVESSLERESSPGAKKDMVIQRGTKGHKGAWKIR